MVSINPGPSVAWIASQKNFLCGLRGLCGSKYKKPINAIYEHFVN
jgi:hypothetical protein